MRLRKFITRTFGHLGLVLNRILTVFVASFVRLADFKSFEEFPIKVK